MSLPNSCNISSSSSCFSVGLRSMVSVAAAAVPVAAAVDVGAAAAGGRGGRVQDIGVRGRVL